MESSSEWKVLTILSTSFGGVTLSFSPAIRKTGISKPAQASGPGTPPMGFPSSYRAAMPPYAIRLQTGVRLCWLYRYCMSFNSAGAPSPTKRATLVLLGPPLPSHMRQRPKIQPGIQNSRLISFAFDSSIGPDTGQIATSPTTCLARAVLCGNLGFASPADKMVPMLCAIKTTPWSCSLSR